MARAKNVTDDLIALQAVALLEGLTAPEWTYLADLARTHTAGRLSYDGWRCAVSKALQRAAGGGREEPPGGTATPT